MHTRRQSSDRDHHFRLDLDATAAGGSSASRRLFASLDPHSTGKKARDCASCHLSSWALGLGTGTLSLSGGVPSFKPAVPAPEDALQDLFAD